VDQLFQGRSIDLQAAGGRGFLAGRCLRLVGQARAGAGAGR
jgi:hypothetical protein